MRRAERQRRGRREETSARSLAREPARTLIPAGPIWGRRRVNKGCPVASPSAHRLPMTSVHGRTPADHRRHRPLRGSSRARPPRPARGRPERSDRRRRHRLDRIRVCSRRTLRRADPRRRRAADLATVRTLSHSIPTRGSCCSGRTLARGMRAAAGLRRRRAASPRTRRPATSATRSTSPRAGCRSCLAAPIMRAPHASVTRPHASARATCCSSCARATRTRDRAQLEIGVETVRTARPRRLPQARRPVATRARRRRPLAAGP